MAQDAAQIKEKIINVIQTKGPSLPVHVAKETGLSILFASAFLSELFNAKQIVMSHLRVGSSPLYFIKGQEAQLENFSQYLKSKEKDAFLLLKEKRILQDSEQQPAIRVALREIKDFAIPFEKNNEVFWRYFIEEEPEKIESKETPEKEKVEKEIPEEKIQEEIKEEEHGKKETKEEKPKKKIKTASKTKKTSKTKKKDENFFNKIKDFLEKQNIEIIDIKDFKNNEAILKIKKQENEELLFVFNQKKITEKEITKSYKKASEEKMKYSILSLGEPSKKLSDLISAIKDLSEIRKIE